MDKFLPKTPIYRDLVTLALIIVPLALAGVIWGIMGDFSEERPPVTPVPTEVSTPVGSPSATPIGFVIVD